MFSAVEQIMHHAIDAELLMRVVERGNLDEGGAVVIRGYRERVERLRHIKDALEHMAWSQTDLVIPAAEAVANGCRAPEWRLPCGESGLLDYFLGVVSTQEPSYELLRPSLRVIANACADTDENRQFVVDQDYLPALIQRLRGPALTGLALALIYNVCLNFEPAQRQVLQDGIMPVLVDVLSSHSTGDNDDGIVESICRLMHLLIESPQATEKSPDQAVKVLLQAAVAPARGLDEFITLVELALAHLSDVRFQRYLVKQCALEMLLSVLVESYSRFAEPENTTVASHESPGSRGSPERAGTETSSVLSRTRDQIIEVISDISALPEFAASYPLESPLVGSLRLWLSVPQTQLRTCACLMLGNLARSDAVCRIMTHDFKLHEPLIQILCRCQEVHSLHAAAGFLKNLAVLPANKTMVGEAKLLDALSRLWTMDAVPQMQYAGAGLTRQVVTGSYDNVRRLLTPLSPDPDSPAHARTYLSLLLHLYHHTDQSATKTEVARTVTAILRVLHTSSGASAEDLDEARRRFYQLHPDLVRPLTYLACQDKPSVVRSEGWFAFALMASTKEGAAVVDDVLADMEVYRLLLEIITGKAITEGTLLLDEEVAGAPSHANLIQGSGPASPTSANVSNIDRENALMLVNQLLKNRADEMPELRRGALENLLRSKIPVHESFEELMSSATSGETYDPDEINQYMPDFDPPSPWS